MNSKDFEFYYKSYKNGNYVGMKLCDESVEKVMKLMKKLKLEKPVSEDDLHITLMYSPNKGNPSFMPSKLEQVAMPTRFALYGDDKNCLVIKLESEGLQERHKEIGSFGFIHTYDEYNPHLTLSYGFEGEEKPDDDLLKDLGELEFCDEYITPLEEDWAGEK